MLSHLQLKNFTVFSETDLEFSKNLNIIIGENGQGKTHLLKLAYSVIAVQSELKKKKQEPTKTILQKAYADKLVSVFRPENLGRLVKRKQGRDRCEIFLKFDNKEQNCSFSFATSSKTDVQVTHLNKGLEDDSPVFFPTRELLTIYPGFVSIYKENYLEFEETYYDTCLLLGNPVARGKREERAKGILDELEQIIGGKIVLEGGRFYLSLPGRGTMEMHLVAEGLRKLAMVARLVSTGNLLDKGYLFWDEPEANLNPKLIKLIAKVILLLCKSGVQIFIATHSLFLLKELEILYHDESYYSIDRRYFGLKHDEGSIIVEQSNSLSGIQNLTVLDLELEQADRLLEL